MWYSAITCYWIDAPAVYLYDVFVAMRGRIGIGTLRLFGAELSM